MQVTVHYCDWPQFSALAGEAFEDTYYDQWESEAGVQGVLPLPKDALLSDSATLYGETETYLNVVLKDAPLTLQAFVQEAFILDHPEPTNDLNCEVAPELLASVVSDQSVGRVMNPIAANQIELSDYLRPLTAEEAGQFTYDEEALQSSSQQWFALWQEAHKNNHGILYHIG